MDRIGHLLGSQLEQVGKFLGASGFDRSDLRWHEHRFSQLQPRAHVAIIHRPTDFSFQFMEGRSGGHEVRYSPGKDSRWESHERLAWPGVMAHLAVWVLHLKREIGALGFWEAFAAEHPSMALPDTEQAGADEPFTSEEVRRLERVVTDLLSKVDQLDLPTEKLEQVRTELSGLIREARNMSRSTWGHFALGTLVSLAAQDLLPAGWVTELWRYFVGILQAVPDVLPPGFPG